MSDQHVQLAFTHALELEGLLERVDAHQARLADPNVDDPERPVLLAVSDNGLQMTSGSTREPLAMCARSRSTSEARHAPGTRPWIESLFSPRQSRLAAPGPDPRSGRPAGPGGLGAPRLQHAPAARRDRLRHPDDEHEGRGPAIRQARRAGLRRARRLRIAYHRAHREGVA